MTLCPLGALESWRCWPRRGLGFVAEWKWRRAVVEIIEYGGLVVA
jgi:hypothetical protein